MTEKHVRDKAAMEKILSKLAEKITSLYEENGQPLPSEGIEDNLKKCLDFVIDIGPERMTILDLYLSGLEDSDDNEERLRLGLERFFERIHGGTEK